MQIVQVSMSWYSVEVADMVQKCIINSSYVDPRQLAKEELVCL